MDLVEGRLVELLHCLEVEAAVKEVDQVGVVPDHDVPPVLHKKTFIFRFDSQLLLRIFIIQ